MNEAKQEETKPEPKQEPKKSALDAAADVFKAQLAKLPPDKLVNLTANLWYMVMVAMQIATTGDRLLAYKTGKGLQLLRKDLKKYIAAVNELRSTKEPTNA